MTLNGTLHPEEISSAIEKASLELEREGVAPEQRLRFRLSLEETCSFTGKSSARRLRFL